jgi:hypothetical protein
MSNSIYSHVLLCETSGKLPWKALCVQTCLWDWRCLWSTSLNTESNCTNHKDSLPTDMACSCLNFLTCYKIDVINYINSYC